MKDYEAVYSKDGYKNITSKVIQANTQQTLKLVHPTNWSNYSSFINFEIRDLCITCLEDI